jgi:hypothetical protein
MTDFDPRVTPARGDLAARHLEGKVVATRFVDGTLREVVAPHAPVRREPRPDAQRDTEALKGERVTVYDANDEGWSWGQLEGDGYVGWLPTDALRDAAAEPTHKVSAVRALVFPGPSVRETPIEALSFGSVLNVARIHQGFALTSDHGFVPLQHVAALGDRETDFVAIAERFVGAPYLWGGKTTLGLDCSALVQLALGAAGLPCPRDSDLQERALGIPLPLADDFSNLKRGDLIFWDGHVAIVRDGASVVHANAHHMAVAIEPIMDTISHMRAAGAKLSSVRRIAVTA